MSGNANSGRRPLANPARREATAHANAALAKRSAVIRESNAAEMRARIHTAQVIRRLTEHVDGKIELSSSQVKAAQVLLDRTLPSLSSQELHHHDATDGLSEAELLTRLQQLLAALPPDVRSTLSALTSTQ